MALDVRKTEGGYQLTVLAKDRLALFSSVAGALSSFGLNILKAEAFAKYKEILESEQFRQLKKIFEREQSANSLQQSAAAMEEIGPIAGYTALVAVMVPSGNTVISCAPAWAARSAAATVSITRAFVTM